MKHFALVFLVAVCFASCRKNIYDRSPKPEPIDPKKDFPWYPVELRMYDFTKNYYRFADKQDLIDPEKMEASYELTDTNNLNYTVTLTCKERISKPQTSKEILSYDVRLNTTTNYIGAFITLNGPRFKYPAYLYLRACWYDDDVYNALMAAAKYYTFTPFHCTKTVYSIYFKNENEPVDYVFEKY